MVWRATKGWQVESTASLGPNMLSFIRTSGARRWYVIGAYMPPNNSLSMYHMYQTLRAAPKGLEIILMRYLNERLGEPHENCE